MRKEEERVARERGREQEREGVRAGARPAEREVRHATESESASESLWGNNPLGDPWHSVSHLLDATHCPAHLTHLLTHAHKNIHTHTHKNTHSYSSLNPFDMRRELSHYPLTVSLGCACGCETRMSGRGGSGGEERNSARRGRAGRGAGGCRAGQVGRAAAHLGVGGAAGPQISGRQGRGVISHPLAVPVSVCCRSSRGPYTWWWCDCCPDSTPLHLNPSPEHQQVWCPGICFRRSLTRDALLTGVAVLKSKLTLVMASVQVLTYCLGLLLLCSGECYVSLSVTPSRHTCQDLHLRP